MLNNQHNEIYSKDGRGVDQIIENTDSKCSEDTLESPQDEYENSEEVNFIDYNQYDQSKDGEV